MSNEPADDGRDTGLPAADESRADLSETELAPEHAALLEELAALLGAAAEPPADVLHAARELYTWRTVDADLAALTFDSLVDREPARSRATATDTRTLTFESDRAAIEVEVDSGVAGRRLVGQLVPPQAAELELTVDGGDVARTSADELGRFVLPLPGTPRAARLLVLLADGTRIMAESIAL